VKTLRIGAWLSLVVFVNLVFATAAHAQEVPAAPPPPPTGAPPPPPPPPPYDMAAPQLQQPMAAPYGPVVRINSTSPAARLQVMRFKWTDVCRAPCGVPVDPNGAYRIGGGTIRPSEEFRMPRPSGVVDITTDPGSTVKHWVGIGLAAGGAGSLLASVLYFAAASNASANSTDVFGQSHTSDKDAFKALGIVYLVIGVALVAVGIPLAASSTSVEVR
jgi:hypothetical protein